MGKVRNALFDKQETFSEIKNKMIKKRRELSFQPNTSTLAARNNIGSCP